MTAPTARRSPTTGKSNLCCRNLHTQCLIPDTCTCACHEDAPPPVPEAREAALANGAGKAPAASSSTVVWEEPPTVGRRIIALPTPAQLAELDAQPGRWARLHEWPGNNSAYTARKRAHERGLDKTVYQLRGVRLPGGGSALFARRLADLGTAAP